MEKAKTLKYYMSLPYPVEVRHDEDGYFAKVVDLPGCMTWTDAAEELWPMVEDAKRAWIEGSLEEGLPIPEPHAGLSEDYSSRVNLRLPESLHRDLARRAEEEDVSLHQLVVATLARSVAN